MNNQPLVSIITPAYNAERYLTDTVHSVLAQTYSNWELIIADDCSTDGTRKLLGDLSQADDRINVIYLEENGEPPLLETQHQTGKRTLYRFFRQR